MVKDKEIIGVSKNFHSKFIDAHNISKYAF